MVKEKVKLNKSLNNLNLKEPILVETIQLNSCPSSFPFKPRTIEKRQSKVQKVESKQKIFKSSYKVELPSNAQTIDEISVYHQSNNEKSKIEYTEPKKVNLKSALGAIDRFISSFRVLKTNTTNSNESYQPNNFAPRTTDYLKKSELSSRDIELTEIGESVLVGPQDAVDVKINQSSRWPANVSNVEDALNLLNTWSRSISADAENIKHNIVDISSNIETALQDINGYSPIGPTSPVSALRGRVNDLQRLLKNLYDKF